MQGPLADRLRPRTPDDVVGQRHLLAPDRALRRILDSGKIPNMVFYGPPGVGKTTVAEMLAKKTDRKLVKLNGTTASLADLKEMIGELHTFETMHGVLLYLDEIQYLNKKQQQVLLEFLENGQITLIAATTENPYFYVYHAILSRATVFEFKPVPAQEVQRAVERGFSVLEQEDGQPLVVEDGVCAHIATACGGDVRKALNAVELCGLAAEQTPQGKRVTLELAQELTQRSAMRYDKDGDAHYDLLSAFQKSMRGSDADAAVYYLARLLVAGDLPSVCRRLLVCASEDVGLAYPQILPVVKAAVDIALQVGLPEARIPLADAVILVSLAPKSNTAYLAVDRAMRDIEQGKLGEIPRQLQNKHYDGADCAKKGQFYLYPHDCPDGWVEQQYLPDVVQGTPYYTFGKNKTEQAFLRYWQEIKEKNKS